MEFFKSVGNFFKQIGKGIVWFFKKAILCIAIAVGWLFKTTAGRIISTVLGTILTLIIIYYFVKYGLPIVGRALL